MNVLLLVAAVTFSLSATPQSTITARSGSSADIQSAVNAAKPGDIVVVPEGRFNFSGQVFMPDGLTIRGAGRDRTWIVKADRLGEWEAMLNVDCRTGRPFNFSGITLQGARPLAVDQGLIMRGRCEDFQIYDSRFTRFGRAAIELVGEGGEGGTVQGSQRGVIYRNEFVDNWFVNLGYAVAVNGAAQAWNAPLKLGTDQAVFIEDNYFEANRCAVIGNNGAKYVFRHNEIFNNREDSAPIYAHGRAGWPRGTRSWEIYGNRVRNPVARWAGIVLGGGSGVVFNNDLNDVFNAIILNYYGPGTDQISDAWIWNNTRNGQPVVAPSVQGTNAAAAVQQGRDFFMERKPDYQPFAYPHPLRR